MKQGTDPCLQFLSLVMSFLLNDVIAIQSHISVKTTQNEHAFILLNETDWTVIKTSDMR